MYREPVGKEEVSIIRTRVPLAVDSSGVCLEGKRESVQHTLVADLEDGPQHLVFLLSLVRGILGILHLIAELEKSVFYVVEAGWRRFAIAGSANGRHSELAKGSNKNARQEKRDSSR